MGGARRPAHRRRRACAAGSPTPGFAVLAAGLDPFREPARTLTRPRYDAMQAYFDEWGPEGRRMMSSCASIQVNIDSGDEATLARRWDLAHRIGPAMAATFACSPGPLHRSERLATWNAMDPTRTKPVLASGRLTEDWTDYVLEARLMLVHEDDDSCEPVAVPITFGEWIDEGIAGRRRHARRPRLPLHHAVPARCARAAGSRCAGSTASRPGSPRWPAPPSPRCSSTRTPATEALEACAGVDGRASWATTASLGTQDPALAAAGGWLLTVGRAGARPQRARRRAGRRPWPTPPSAGRPRAARRPTTSRSGWPPGATVLDLADPPVEVWP